jgi:hypothetical protein
MLGISMPTLWRLIRTEQVRTVLIGSTRIIPRSEVARLGLNQP